MAPSKKSQSQPPASSHHSRGVPLNFTHEVGDPFSEEDHIIVDDDVNLDDDDEDEEEII